jgi:hypothetical protein
MFYKRVLGFGIIFEVFDVKEWQTQNLPYMNLKRSSKHNRISIYLSIIISIEGIFLLE